MDSSNAKPPATSDAAALADVAVDSVLCVCAVIIAVAVLIRPRCRDADSSDVGVVPASGLIRLSGDNDDGILFDGVTHRADRQCRQYADIIVFVAFSCGEHVGILLGVVVKRHL